MIKFRAWWMEQEVICDVDVIGFGEGAITVSNENTTYKHLGLNEVELMQYTGLKDKNGVEIFEGDIVRYTWDRPGDVNATEKGKKVRIAKVFWSDWRASWAVGQKSCNDYLFRFARNGNTVEVIGNIWEDGELLEVAE